VSSPYRHVASRAPHMAQNMGYVSGHIPGKQTNKGRLRAAHSRARPSKTLYAAVEILTPSCRFSPEPVSFIMSCSFMVWLPTQLAGKKYVGRTMHETNSVLSR
jgi:hypothetical protein